MQIGERRALDLVAGHGSRQVRHVEPIELTGIGESLRRHTVGAWTQHDEVPAENELLTTVVARLALLAARNAVTRAEQVVDTLVVLIGYRPGLVPNVGGVEPAGFRAQEVARFAEFLVTLGPYVKLFPEACTNGKIPIVWVGHVDGATRREPDVALLASPIAPKLVGRGVGLDSAAQRAHLPVGVKARATQLARQDG